MKARLEIPYEQLVVIVKNHLSGNVFMRYCGVDSYDVVFRVAHLTPEGEPIDVKPSLVVEAT